MIAIADLHIHSKYSRATSPQMDLPTLEQYAQIKGLRLLGTGDFTHPLWLEELKQNLEEVAGTGLYRLRSSRGGRMLFMITTEVCTCFKAEGELKRVHHVISTPSIAQAEQINDRLSAYGDLSADGRPLLQLSASELVEEVLSSSDENVVFPAHVWTPWFSLFGAFSGFDSVTECYQDMSRHIFALETGLSSDPSMNWRLTALDGYALISNSDSHSPWPWRIGREANVFKLDELTYDALWDAVRSKDPERFLRTIEVNPAYGKYHWTGHRKCGFSASPSEAARFGNKCPVCGGRLTLGVEQRIESLADRPEGGRPPNVIPFLHLLPLSEIIAAVLGSDQLGAKSIWEIYKGLTDRFGDEFNVLIEASETDMAGLVDPKIAEAVVRVRERQVKVVPGYDGVYGKLILFPDEQASSEAEQGKYSRLEDFM